MPPRGILETHSCHLLEHVVSQRLDGLNSQINIPCQIGSPRHLASSEFQCFLMVGSNRASQAAAYRR